MTTTARSCPLPVPFLLGAILLAGSGLAMSQSSGKGKVDYRNPPRVYEEVTSSGRTYRVEKQLLEEDAAAAKEAVERLGKNIDEAIKTYPSHAREGLESVQLYILYGSKATGGGRDSGLVYFREVAPDHRAELDPAWRNVIVIYSSDNYRKITDLWALKSVAHELAHAYHLQNWPEKQSDILAADENTMKRGLYRRVKNNKGGITEMAYATVNQLEYFAELSCIYFFECDYFPTRRAELKSYDPTGYEMMEKMWKVND